LVEVLFDPERLVVERSWRYSMFVDNGIIKKMFIEPGFSDNCETDPFEVSDVDTMLAYLKSK
jgi:peroxiredoxin